MKATGHQSSKISPYRAGVVLILLLAFTVFLQEYSGTRATKIVRSLSSFPARIGTWKLVESRSSSSKIIKILGVDDYIDYLYSDAHGNTVNLYVGFYESVGNGKGYHSPKNCLPGGGWGINEEKKVWITPQDKAEKSVSVAELIIRHGSEYQVVLYWYQNRGRIIASEYLEKIYLVLDSILRRRTDGSFVRIMTYAPDGDIGKAESLLKEFSELSLAELEKYLPGSHSR